MTSSDRALVSYGFSQTNDGRLIVPWHTDAQPGVRLGFTVGDRISDECGKAVRFHGSGLAGRVTGALHLDMKFTVSKKFTFESAHSLPYLPVGHKCRNVHGHSYVVEVFCSGPLDARGFVVDFAEISDAMRPVVDRLDHQYLNDILPFATTAENLGAWIIGELAPALPTLSHVHVHETARTCARVER